ncbi:MAG: VOC family protein [Saprospiraceae bacterium]|nr:VOC family protein [Saprospiraceae bacterium]
MNKENQIYPCLWFDQEASQAAEFYCQAFNAATILHRNKMVTKFEIEGQPFMALNGGPRFTKNPSISFFVMLESGEVVDQIFQNLEKEGQVLMPLQAYPWSEKYGWCQDKYGVNWQVMITKDSSLPKIIPAFMFTQDQAGMAEYAMNRYVSIFQDSGILDISRYGPNDQDTEGTINHGRFKINNQLFIAFDSSSSHAFKFNEAISMVIPCDTQDEIDHYWERLIADGGSESRCGWLKDPFGISWQVVPANMGQIMSNPDKAERVMKAVMTMRKLDLKSIIDA